MPPERVPGLPAPKNPDVWPGSALDVAALRAGGWRPTPFRDVVLKVHQRCNLSCAYCYVYEMADQSWRDRPVLMARETWLATASRMAQHARTHGLSSMRLILHGGEPLLAGPDLLAQLVDDFRATLDGLCRLDVQVQTNGLLLDAPMLDRLSARGVAIGVSLDGTRADNDRHRRHANGQSSFAAVERALRLLGTPRYRPAFAGLLCTVDPAAEPVACYEALLGYGPPSIDFLLPHANWSNPPRRAADASSTPHGDWLVAVFDRWYDARPLQTRVRLFEDVVKLALGGTSRSEQVGLSPVAVVVVETDGAIEQVDSLKSAYAGACATGLTVFADPLDGALEHPGVVARQIGVDALSETCLHCSIRAVCGGGHYAHRYRAGDGFRNPTVYCGDMYRLIRHIMGRVAADVHDRLGTYQ
ncbi:FxsB family cyclophane-forming radical SAM/SPASM peptide maturase [Phytohabitans sp. ZYX-F-186]|uniref:FxsB family cyclophane-forming radical SAM/SPASM peptide maturase n=1 Tax=Phytohabitans maris TaxID=3071409 RepID=A0ABU0ZCY7_9ACTN|nr:FxsB family cyclophane-forming radical SAM/SPASM peptide maturase [Phytohabitans sp. ZYX-F-186]MDQ7904915.1 FxsB family cyclophane-forming radical SAM/SPASM peptide maturase [Phytohabitans sp. ZYX-F-186]